MLKIIVWIYQCARNHQSAIAWVVGPIWTFILWSTFLNDSWQLLFDFIGNLPDGSGAKTLSMQSLAFANYFIPLDVFAMLIEQYAVLLVLTTTIRILKSFVPTIA